MDKWKITFLIVFLLSFIFNFLYFVKPPLLAAQTPTDTEILPTSTPDNLVSPADIPQSEQHLLTLDLSFRLPGIGNEGNTTPLHPNRQITIQIYNATDDLLSTTTTPVASLSTTLIFNPATKLFSNPRVPLENVQTGQYQIVVQMPHYLKQQLENSLDKTKIISFESTSSALFSSVKLIPGDISPLPNGDNIIDVKDYQALVNCYGSKANTPSCLNKDAPDLNDDGVIDGIDYNIFLFGLRIYLIQNNLLPSLTPAPHVSGTTPVFSPARQVFPTHFASPTTIPKLPVASKKTNTFPLIVIFLLFIVLLAIFVIRKFLHKKQPEKAEKTTDTQIRRPAAEPIAYTFEKTCYVKIVRPDETKGGVWVSLADNEEIHEGYSQDKNIQEGFAQVKGNITKSLEGKDYIEIKEIKPEK